MRRYVIWLLCAASLTLIELSAAKAQERGFGSMYDDQNSQPKSSALIDDPTGFAPTKKVRVFHIDPICSKVAYDSTGKSSDCAYNSARSERAQSSQSQPKERWYGWSFYLPADFPVGRDQKAGGQYMLGQWHNGQCPHVAIVNSPNDDTMLYFVTNIAKGNYECERDEKIPIADMRSLRGKWTKVEIFSRWSGSTDGIFVIYLNGKLVLDFKGRTLTKGYEQKNYFKYGIYQCCTKGVELISPYQMYYANVRSSAKRDGLQ